MLRNRVYLATNLSLSVMLLANAVPLIGVLFYGWDVAFVLALFWIENLIIGIVTLLKMVIVVFRQRHYSELAVCAFFVLHYGVFCMAHGALLWSLLDLGTLDPNLYFSARSDGLAEVFVDGATVFLSFLDQFGEALQWAVLALTLSHGIRLIEHFVLRGDVFNANVNQLMSQPYPRIVILHAGLLLGAIILEKLGSPVWLLVIIVLLKMAADVINYRKTPEQNTT